MLKISFLISLLAGGLLDPFSPYLPFKFEFRIILVIEVSVSGSCIFSFFHITVTSSFCMYYKNNTLYKPQCFKTYLHDKYVHRNVSTMNRDGKWLPYIFSYSSSITRYVRSWFQAINNCKYVKSLLTIVINLHKKMMIKQQWLHTMIPCTKQFV